VIFPGTLVSAADLLKLRYRRRHAIEHPARCRIWFRVSRDCDYAAAYKLWLAACDIIDHLKQAFGVVLPQPEMLWLRPEDEIREYKDWPEEWDWQNWVTVSGIEPSSKQDEMYVRLADGYLEAHGAKIVGRQP